MQVAQAIALAANRDLPIAEMCNIAEFLRHRDFDTPEDENIVGAACRRTIDWWLTYWDRLVDCHTLPGLEQLLAESLFSEDAATISCRVNQFDVGGCIMQLFCHLYQRHLFLASEPPEPPLEHNPGIHFILMLRKIAESRGQTLDELLAYQEGLRPIANAELEEITRRSQTAIDVHDCECLANTNN